MKFPIILLFLLTTLFWVQFTLSTIDDELQKCRPISLTTKLGMFESKAILKWEDDLLKTVVQKNDKYEYEYEDNKVRKIIFNQKWFELFSYNSMGLIEETKSYRITDTGSQDELKTNFIFVYDNNTLKTATNMLSKDKHFYFFNEEGNLDSLITKNSKGEISKKEYFKYDLSPNPFKSIILPFHNYQYSIPQRTNNNLLSQHQSKERHSKSISSRDLISYNEYDFPVSIETFKPRRNFGVVEIEYENCSSNKLSKSTRAIEDYSKKVFNSALKANLKEYLNLIELNEEEKKTFLDGYDSEFYNGNSEKPWKAYNRNKGLPMRNLKNIDLSNLKIDSTKVLFGFPSDTYQNRSIIYFHDTLKTCQIVFDIFEVAENEFKVTGTSMRCKTFKSIERETRLAAISKKIELNNLNKLTTNTVLEFMPKVQKHQVYFKIEQISPNRIIGDVYRLSWFDVIRNTLEKTIEENQPIENNRALVFGKNETLGSFLADSIELNGNKLMFSKRVELNHPNIEIVSKIESTKSTLIEFKISGSSGFLNKVESKNPNIEWLSNFPIKGSKGYQVNETTIRFVLKSIGRIEMSTFEANLHFEIDNKEYQYKLKGYEDFRFAISII